MDVKSLLADGNLGAAIDLVTASLRSKPGDVSLRATLFDLLCFSGQWDRALKQLEVVAHQSENPASLLGVQVLRQLVAAENDRKSTLAGKTRPRFLFEPGPAFTERLHGLSALASGRNDEARHNFDLSNESIEPSPGTRDGLAFDSIQDGDDRLAPVLEVLAASGYFWVGWDQVQYLEVSPPRSLRDLLWSPAKLAVHDGQLGEVFLPNLYPGTSDHPDDLVRLGRKTEWEEMPGGIVRGIGLKTFLVGEDSFTTPELGAIQINAPRPEAETGS